MGWEKKGKWFYILVCYDYLFQLLWFLKYHINKHFQVLIDICGVDHPSRRRRFEIVYNLLRVNLSYSIVGRKCYGNFKHCQGHIKTTKLQSFLSFLFLQKLQAMITKLVASHESEEMM